MNVLSAAMQVIESDYFTFRVVKWEYNYVWSTIINKYLVVLSDTCKYHFSSIITCDTGGIIFIIIKQQ